MGAGTNDDGNAESAAGASPGCKSVSDTPEVCATDVATYHAALPGMLKQRADKGEHMRYVDMSSMPGDGLGSDGVHPTATVGYSWIGSNRYAAIKAYLRWLARW